jgi:hypothetical protein
MAATAVDSITLEGEGGRDVVAFVDSLALLEQGLEVIVYL